MHAPTLAATLIATSATSATAPHVSGGAKAGAIGIGIAVLVLLYIVTVSLTLSAGGQLSNPVKFTVTAPVASTTTVGNGASAPAGAATAVG